MNPTVHISTGSIEGPHGPIEVRLYRPSQGSSAALVWVHGGGFVAGSLDMPSSHWVAERLASAHDIEVVTIGYRLATAEVHFPVPLDDVHAAWCQYSAGAGPQTPRAIHLGGSSAGGNLAVATALRVRDGGGPVPRSLALVCPTLHDINPPPSPELATKLAGSRHADEAAWITPLYEAYVGYPLDDTTAPALAAPARAVLDGLPPTLIVNSDHDPVRASGETFAAALTRAGVPVTMTTEAGTSHGHINEPANPAATMTVERVAAWIKR